MTAQALIEKIQQLPPERLGEVEDFVDFLAQRHEGEVEDFVDFLAQRHEHESQFQLTKAATKLSETTFSKVWDNPEDEIYDQL